MTGLAAARLSLGEPRQALDLLRQARSHSKGEKKVIAAIYRLQGHSHLALGERNKAVRELRKSLAEDPADVDTAIALATTLLEDEDADLSPARGPLSRPRPPYAQIAEVRP